MLQHCYEMLINYTAESNKMLPVRWQHFLCIYTGGDYGNDD